jgi:hypothetical protein
MWFRPELTVNESTQLVIQMLGMQRTSSDELLGRLRARFREWKNETHVLTTRSQIISQLNEILNDNLGASTEQLIKKLSVPSAGRES